MTKSRLLALGSALLLLIAIRAAAEEQAARMATGGQMEAVTGNVEHGRYLVEDVIMCWECHSTHDRQGDVIPGTKFRGGPLPITPPAWATNWAVVTPRIAGLPGYTEELGIRLLTQGAIDRRGQQLRLPMPRFHMSRQDAADVVAYLKRVR